MTIERGVVPAGTKLTARPAEIPAWDSLTGDQKRLFARQMETFAGFGEHTDHEVGRLIEAIRDMGELDNTLIFCIVGDNGASAEGGPDGSYNELLALNGIVSDISSQLSHIDERGGPKGRSSATTAEVEVPKGGANGVIIAQAGRFGGWSLYMKGGRVHEVYNFGGLERTTVSSPEALSPGRHTILYDFAYDGGKPGSGGMSRLSVDGKQGGEARVPHTMPFGYSADEGVDVGMDNETPVTEDYKQGGHANKFNGKIQKVIVELK